MTTKTSPRKTPRKKTAKAKIFNVPDHIDIHFVTEGMQSGWVHTHGMADLGLPELEIRDVPLFLASPAASLINHIAQYMYDGKHGIGRAKPVKLGQRFGTGPMQIVKFVMLHPIAGGGDHYDDERWALSDEPMRDMCGMCGGSHPGETLH